MSHASRAQNARDGIPIADSLLKTLDGLAATLSIAPLPRT
jgi:hypothetical protein